MISSTGTIAVVDDDKRVLESLEDLLESAGYAVLTFGSGVDLLKKLDLSRIDCLITDIGMPQIDGLELRRIVRTRRPALPVILITGRHEIVAQRMPIEGSQGLFCKPFDGPTLLAAVRAATFVVNKGG